MTVSEMIAQLQRFPGHLHVIVSMESDSCRIGIEPKAFVVGTRILIINTDLRWTDFHDIVDARSTAEPETE